MLGITEEHRKQLEKVGPINVTAIIYNGCNHSEVDEFLGGVEWKTIYPPIACVNTPHGIEYARNGDAIIKINNNFYVVKGIY